MHIIVLHLQASGERLPRQWQFHANTHQKQQQKKENNKQKMCKGAQKVAQS